MGIAEILLSIALLSWGVVLFLVVRKVLEQMGIFRGHRADVMAFSIGCLVVPSVAMFLLIPDGVGESGHSHLSVNFELLPGFAVCGIITLFLSLVITALSAPVRANEVPPRVSAHKSVKPKSVGRPKKNEEKPSRTSQKPSGKRKNEAKVSSPAEGGATT